MMLGEFWVALLTLEQLGCIQTCIRGYFLPQICIQPKRLKATSAPSPMC